MHRFTIYIEYCCYRCEVARTASRLPKNDSCITSSISVEIPKCDHLVLAAINPKRDRFIMPFAIA